MLTVGPAFVMSSVGLFKCRQTPLPGADLFAVQIASAQKAIIAKRKTGVSRKYSNSLFLMNLIADRLWHACCFSCSHRTTEARLMISALLLSNAIALTVLPGFHFTPESGAAQVAQRMPHYLQLQKAPPLAVKSDQHGFASQENILMPAPSAERLVF
ncbi:hypothetical protein ABIA48_004269 [Pseudomonas sp. S30_BP2TU TE3576]